MKKILLFLAVMCFACVLKAQVYLFEDFGTGAMPPTGWTLDGVPAQWSNSASNNAGGSPPEAKFSYVNQNTTSRLVSPIVDLTGIADVTLSFKHFYDYYAAGPKIGVATRFGTTGAWTIAWQLTPSGNVGPKTQVVNLTNVGQANFQFCFFIQGNLYNVDYWYIDDIKLFTPLALDANLNKIDIPKYVQIDAPFDLKGTVSNDGATAINSFDISYTIDGGSPQINTVANLNLQLGDVYNFTHEIPLVLSNLGNHEIVTTINNVNGGSDLDTTNNTLSKIVGVVSFIPSKKVFAEEATGTWCGWCVRGICFMDYMAETYPDTWIGVAVHNGDPMVVTEYDDAIGNIIPGFVGYPSVTSDRTAGNSDPTDLEAGYLLRMLSISPATIDIVNFSWNPDTRNVSFDLKSEFVVDVNSELRFGMIITEDSLHGTSSQWNQVNYYQGGSNGPMCGFENQPNPIPAAQMYFSHVARKISDTPYGTAGSLPLNILAGSKHSYNYSFTIPTDWNYDKLHFIGILIDMANGEVLNANNVINNFLEMPENQVNDNLNIYPNPFGDFTNISFKLCKPAMVKVEICNMLGETVYRQQSREFPAGENKVRLVSENLGNGVYLVNVTIDKQIVSRRISVVK